MLKLKSRLTASLFMACLLFLAFLGLTPGILTPAPQAGQPATPTPGGNSIVAAVSFFDQADLNRLAGELDIWEVDHRQNVALAQLTPRQVADLRRAGYRVVIDLPKTTRLYAPLQSPAGQKEGIPGFPCYRTVEETYTDLAQLAAAHPDLVEWIDIGDSWQKVTLGRGYDIYVALLTNRRISGPKPKFFLMSAVHARELSTAELTTRFAEYLVTHYDTDPDITWLLDQFEIHILPQANPDGRKQAEAGLFWRKNIDNDDGCTISNSWGVDLNRNSSFKWNGCSSAGCSSSNACNTTYRGPSASSEPETQAIETYLASLFPDQRGPNDEDPVPDEATGIFITLHSYGELVLFPWGWDEAPAPNNAQLERLGRKFGYYTGYEVCQAGEPGCIYATDGTNDDWAYGELGLAAYTLELGTTFFQSCAYFEETIIPENFPALRYAFKATRRPYQTPAGPETLQVTVTPTSVVAGMPLTLTAVADDTLYDSNGWGNEATQNISDARYTVNLPSWQAGVISYSLSPADGAFDTPSEMVQTIIDTAGWEPGRYQIIVESLDTDGNWGVPTAVFFWVAGTNDVNTKIFLPLVQK